MSLARIRRIEARLAGASLAGPCSDGSPDCPHWGTGIRQIVVMCPDDDGRERILDRLPMHCRQCGRHWEAGGGSEVGS